MSSEPVLLVSVVPQGSSAVRVDLSNRILGFEYEDCENKADKLKLIVDNYDLSNFDDPVWRKGNLVEVSWGYPDRMAPTRVCQIRKVTGAMTLNVEAHGLEVALNMRARCRVFEHMTRADVALQIAEEWGYRSPEVLHIEDTEVVHETIVQGRLTDAQFMRRLANKEGYEFYIDFDGFHFHQRDVTQRPVRILEWGGPEILAEGFSIDNDITGKPGAVRARSRDPVARRTIDILSDNDTEKTRGVMAEVVELAGAALENVPGFGNIASEEIVTTTETSDQGAKRLAAGRFRRAQQVAVKMTIPIEGDPNMLAKSVIELRGLGKRLSQRYYVREVKHVIKSGYQCTLKVVSDGSGGHSTQSQRAVGALAIQVGPGVKGRRGLPSGDVERRSIDIDPAVRKPLKGTDADGQPVVKYQDQRHRETPKT